MAGIGIVAMIAFFVLVYSTEKHNQHMKDEFGLGGGSVFFKDKKKRGALNDKNTGKNDIGE